VLCLPEGAAVFDPLPEETARRDVELLGEWQGSQAAVVGFGEGSWSAVGLAAAHGELVERLVLVSAPVPDEPPPPVSARTLLLFGSKDPAGGQRQAVWWRDRLGGRIEMIPGAGADILERVWPRVLSHVAPGALRKESGRLGREL
jgi:pimeloyl-ACP methyl ester carboxylesterase